MILRQLAFGAMTIGLGLLAAGGCSTNTPGVTDTAGRFDMLIDAPPATVARAADSVIENYKFPIESFTFSKADGHLLAHTAQGTEVQLWINQQGDNVSKIEIRVGLTGDEALSQQILKKIKNKSTSTGAEIMGKVHGDSN
jgi:hypothetical protein